MKKPAKVNERHPVKVKWPGYHLHGQVLQARRCLMFSEHCWEVEDKAGQPWVIPLNRAAGCGPAWQGSE